MFSRLTFVLCCFFLLMCACARGFKIPPPSSLLRFRAQVWIVLKLQGSEVFFCSVSLTSRLTFLLVPPTVVSSSSAPVARDGERIQQQHHVPETRDESGRKRSNLSRQTGVLETTRHEESTLFVYARPDPLNQRLKLAFCALKNPFSIIAADTKALLGEAAPGIKIIQTNKNERNRFVWKKEKLA